MGNVNKKSWHCGCKLWCSFLTDCLFLILSHHYRLFWRLALNEHLVLQNFSVTQNEDVHIRREVSRLSSHFSSERTEGKVMSLKRIRRLVLCLHFGQNYSKKRATGQMMNHSDDDYTACLTDAEDERENNVLKSHSTFLLWKRLPRERERESIRLNYNYITIWSPFALLFFSLEKQIWWFDGQKEKSWESLSLSLSLLLKILFSSSGNCFSCLFFGKQQQLHTEKIILIDFLVHHQWQREGKTSHSCLHHHSRKISFSCILVRLALRSFKEPAWTIGREMMSSLMMSLVFIFRRSCFDPAVILFSFILQYISTVSVMSLSFVCTSSSSFLESSHSMLHSNLFPHKSPSTDYVTYDSWIE